MSEADLIDPVSPLIDPRRELRVQDEVKWILVSGLYTILALERDQVLIRAVDQPYGVCVWRPLAEVWRPQIVDLA